MEIGARRRMLAEMALDLAKSYAVATQLLEQQLLADYVQGKLTIDQVLEKLEARAVENARRIKAARLRWARRGEPFQQQ